MSLNYCHSETTYTALSSRWGNAPAALDACAAAAAESAIQSDEPDYNLISDRWNEGVPYFKIQKLDGVGYVFECSYIDRIDAYMVSECAAELLRSELSHFLDFIKYQDGELVRHDLIALDDLLVNMVISGEDCQTLQGALCG